MRTLIVEDDFTSRLLLQEMLKEQGVSHIAANGVEAISAVRAALEAGEPYDLICLDIMLPEVSGQDVLKAIRALEEEFSVALQQAVKVVMTTALSDPRNVYNAYRNHCDAYLTKPIRKSDLMTELRGMGLVSG